MELQAQFKCKGPAEFTAMHPWRRTLPVPGTIQVQGTGRVLRQGCMAVRNIASRSPHVRELLRSYSAVEVIENAKAVAQGACGDVGDAAIRDVTNCG